MKRKPPVRRAVSKKKSAPKRSTPVAAATARPLNAAQIRSAVRSKRFLAADRAALDLSEIATWDRYLLREHRLLVPIDVQALYVPPDSTEPMVRLPMLVSGENGVAVENVEDGMPDPFTQGTPRPAGVHLHWAMPDALMRGKLGAVADGSTNRFKLPALPDRWVVLRLMLPNDGREALVTGWVLEADRAIAVPLGTWTENGAAAKAATPAGVALDPAQLTGTVGGGVTWAAVYDAVLNRFALHDPLSDLPKLAAGGVDEDCATYLVSGWWSNAAFDPLDAARSDASLDELLLRLRWRLTREFGDESLDTEKEYAEWRLKKALGLTTEEYWSSKRPVTPDIEPAGQRPPGASAATLAAAANAFTAMDKGRLEKAATFAPGSVFAVDAIEHLKAKPWHLRSSLLHGAVYGVPVAGGVPIDRRPSAAALSVALGLHDDDLLGALTASGGTPQERRQAEQMLTAFTAQKVNRLRSSDGLAELEEHEHGAAFASVPAGSAGTDRYVQRVQTGGAGGLKIGRGSRKHMRAESMTKVFSASSPPPGAMAQKPTAAQSAQTLLSFQAKPALVSGASLAMIQQVAHSRVKDVLAPTEARVIDRPAPRWTFPTDPMVAIRGASRSLRHGHDGKGSADGMLTCRWPSQVIEEITGVIAPDRFVRSLGSGAVPREILRLAREALLHDPYHDEWIAAAVTPPGKSGRAVLNRLKAESVLRFGANGTYDGTTVAFNPNVPKTSAARRRLAAQRAQGGSSAGMRQQQAQVHDEILKFSLYKGVDPDVTGVTAWAQPWVPMWIEWEATVEGLDPPSLQRWVLDTVDLDSASLSIEGGTVSLRGRAVLTTGGAKTLHSAIRDWLAAEDALDDEHAGLVDESTEAAYRVLRDEVEHLDVVTASLDGLRLQLLGFPVLDGLVRPGDGQGGTRNPAPTAAPRAVLAGAVTLTRARLLDVFGRTLEVPLASVATPARASIAQRDGTLELAPRLLRPARWNMRWVAAGTSVGAEGVEARIDQIDPLLQVNPVAGFLLPDHLDESLEVFAADGSPVGELLHEAASGGVTWEIAAGREGPADAGPAYGLVDSQRALSNFANGLLAADAQARGGAPLADGQESALSALLRAIDTTLWSVDSFAALGAEHVAGLVGRPIAVARAQLRLELRPPDDVDLSDPARAAEWAAAVEEAKRHAFPVRIGELTRSDDGVLGFFVDDDYAHFRLVDKVIAGTAADAGRSRGKLGLFGGNTGKPPASAIAHPYIAGTDDADTLALHIGQSVTLTILMLPSGKCSLTSGVLPRKSLGLARDWVGPGLAKIAPSLRTGPVLVETDLDTESQVRLPKVSVFGKHQNFLWRDTPATWRTDAILAATQTALLPDTPAELREGWIRVAPDDPAEGQGTP